MQSFTMGGRFVNSPPTQYIGGSVYVQRNLDIDIWSFFELLGIVKEIGYREEVKLWWKREPSIDEFKWIENDNVAMEVAEHCVKSKGLALIYVEHVEKEVGVNGNVEGDGNVDNGGSESDEESGSDVDGSVVHFDDSEEERALGLGDGFDEGQCTFVNAKRRSVSPKKRSIGEGSGQEREHDDNSDNHVMVDEYLSDELDTDEDSDCEQKGKRMYPKFRKEELDKNFVWKLGMEFNSLDEFKEAILEYHVLIGREIKFEKNDLVRVKVVCSSKCGYKIRVSRVGENERNCSGNSVFRLFRM